MQIQAIIFDLFHTLTGPDAEWSELPWTADVLGVDRGVWNELLVSRSRWRLAGQETDAHTIVRTLAREIDPDIPRSAFKKPPACEFSDSRIRSPGFPPKTLRHSETSGRQDCASA